MEASNARVASKLGPSLLSTELLACGDYLSYDTLDENNYLSYNEKPIRINKCELLKKTNSGIFMEKATSEEIRLWLLLIICADKVKRTMIWKISMWLSWRFRSQDRKVKSVLKLGGGAEIALLSLYLVTVGRSDRKGHTAKEE